MTSKTLRLASFGIRGYVGGALTPRAATDFALAFATVNAGGKVLVGRDTRRSSDLFHHAVVSGLRSAGCEVVDLGICPTPMLQWLVPREEAAGGVSISGGHNGMGWNAITLIGSDGAFLDPVGGANVLDVYHSGNFRQVPWDQVGSHHIVDGAGAHGKDPLYSLAYFDALEEFLDADAIRKVGFTVLIDPVGGAGCRFLEPFCRRLNLKLVPINAEPSGYLPRDPEPRPRTARHMASIIPHVSADVAFALSSDMGRLSMVTEALETASEEYTLPLIADHVLARNPGPVVTNCCTTRMLDDVAKRHGQALFKTEVGQAYVVSRLADENGAVGGEGNGSVCVPAFSRAFDGFLMMGLVLEAMAVSGAPVSQLVSRLPRYAIVKRAVEVASTRDAYVALERLKKNLRREFGEERITTLDGVRVNFDDGWVHVRTSRTERMVRILSEASHADIAERRQEAMARRITHAWEGS